MHYKEDALKEIISMLNKFRPAKAEKPKKEEASEESSEKPASVDEKLMFDMAPSDKEYEARDEEMKPELAEKSEEQEKKPQYEEDEEEDSSSEEMKAYVLAKFGKKSPESPAKSMKDKLAELTKRK